MKVIVISIITGAFGTVPKGPGKEIGGTGDQTRNGDRKTDENCCHSDFSE